MHCDTPGGQFAVDSAYSTSSSSRSAADPGEVMVLLRPAIRPFWLRSERTRKVVSLASPNGIAWSPVQPGTAQAVVGLPARAAGPGKARGAPRHLRAVAVTGGGRRVVEGAHGGVAARRPDLPDHEVDGRPQVLLDLRRLGPDEVRLLRLAPGAGDADHHQQEQRQGHDELRQRQTARVTEESAHTPGYAAHARQSARTVTTVVRQPGPDAAPLNSTTAVMVVVVPVGTPG